MAREQCQVCGEKQATGTIADGGTCGIGGHVRVCDDCAEIVRNRVYRRFQATGEYKAVAAQ